MARKSNNARDFFKELKQAQEPAPFYLLFGEEAFLLDLALDTVVKNVLPQGINDFNFDQFYGKEAVGDRVVGACETLSFMGGRRLVMVKDIAQVPTSQLKPVADYLKNPSPSTTLICHGLTSQKKLLKTTSFWKQGKKAGVVHEFKALRDWEVGPFLKKRAARRGLNLSNEAEDTLIKAVGTDLATLDASLEKVDLYMGPSEGRREVTEEVLLEVVAVTRTREIWDLTDAVAQRNLAKSISLLHTMLEQGQAAVGINMMVARHFRQLWQVKAAVRKGLNKSEIASKVGMSPFFVDRSKKAAEGFSERALRKILDVVLRTDKALKSSRLNDRILLERMVLDICT